MLFGCVLVFCYAAASSVIVGVAVCGTFTLSLALTFGLTLVMAWYGMSGIGERALPFHIYIYIEYGEYVSFLILCWWDKDVRIDMCRLSCRVSMHVSVLNCVIVIMCYYIILI